MVGAASKNPRCGSRPRSLSSDQTTQAADALSKAYGGAKVSSQFIGPSWGADVTNKAVRGLLVFLVLVSLVMTIYFRNWRMAVAALVALVHDMVITVGLYAGVGWEVSPATVIGFLTILGYSIYDTVVVFDKVRENNARLLDQKRYTHAELANLALNQTLVRSINTSVVALLPVSGDPVHRCLPAGRGHAARHRAGPVHRHHRGHVLLDLHRHPGGGLAAQPRAGGRQAHRGRARSARRRRPGR